MEFLSNGEIVEGAKTYIQKTYPTYQDDIDTVTGWVKKKETSYRGSASYLKNKIDEVAQFNGIVKDQDFPRTHLPTMLAAMAEMEKDIPENEKKLNTKDVVVRLVRGELTTAHNFGNNTTTLKDSKEHTELALTLFKLLDLLSD